ncbi:MAG TPA: UvrD-helicase domain-containing protein, partial [Microthrixaceae bacterium]|nr:UvrD-helicase domain-containing protein [Microthrixaceae bacterium]
MDADDLLEGLNPAQYEAVTHGDGPLLVVAGAGSGKTRVLTHRIAHLIKVHGVSPFEILAITFTNKAAGEMKERIGRLVGPVAEKMWVSTFHSACVRILRRDATLLGYPSAFTIYDQADAVRLTGYVLRDLNIDPKRFPPRSVHATISAAKNDGLSAEDYLERASVIHERRIGEVFEEYQARLRKAGAMDFDDLLGVTVELLRTEPQVLEHYRNRFGNVLVDEYQDTNPVQNDLVMLLGEEHRNVCVVGDLDQCLVPGTLVRTPDGERPIEDIRVGDRVLGTIGHRSLVPATVTATKVGRYDGLIAELGGKPAPAVGWGLGIERVLALLEEVGVSAPVQAPDAYAVIPDAAALPLATACVEALRAEGCAVVLHAGGKDGLGSMKSQFKKADASGARHALVFGA